MKKAQQRKNSILIAGVAVAALLLGVVGTLLLQQRATDSARTESGAPVASQDTAQKQAVDGAPSTQPAPQQAPNAAI